MAERIQLKSISNTELNDYVISLLKINKIETPLQFLKEEVKNLAKFTNISPSEIDVLRSKILNIYCPNESNAFSLFNLNKIFLLHSTGIPSLDELLGGGLLKGNIVEFCGLPGIGKSIICSTLAINYAKQYNFDTIYLDTKNDFSGIRIHKMLTTLQYSREDIGKIMGKIKVEKIYELENLMNVLTSVLAYHNVSNSILIVDSIPALWFQFLGKYSAKGKILLNKIGIILRRLANEKKMLIFIINIVTRWAEDSEKDVTEESGQSHTTTIKPALGKYWESIPTIRILVEEHKTATTMPLNTNIELQNQRQLKIINSNFYKSGKSCVVHIGHCGVY